MNYLAHLLLAGPDDEALLGNLFGDFVKGNPAGRFNDRICAGIALHRKVDAYADAHPVARRSRNRFSPRRRRFAGIIVDVGCDHFLSRHWHRFSDRDRLAFIDRVYTVLRGNRPVLPGRLGRILDLMIAEDWLGSYRHLESVGITLDRIAGRLSHGDRFTGAVSEIERCYADLEADFLAFFPDLMAYVRELTIPPGATSPHSISGTSSASDRNG